MIEGRELKLKYMKVAIFTSDEYKNDHGHGSFDIVIIDDGDESIVIKNSYGSYNLDKLKELDGICYMCNENPNAHGYCACSTCPSIPYDCICDAGDEPHDIKCPCNPKGPKPHRTHKEMYGWDPEPFDGDIQMKELGWK